MSLQKPEPSSRPRSVPGKHSAHCRQGTALARRSSGLLPSAPGFSYGVWSWVSAIGFGHGVWPWGSAIAFGHGGQPRGSAMGFGHGDQPRGQPWDSATGFCHRFQPRVPATGSLPWFQVLSDIGRARDERLHSLSKCHSAPETVPHIPLESSPTGPVGSDQTLQGRVQSASQGHDGSAWRASQRRWQ